jgi:hypothetical protein
VFGRSPRCWFHKQPNVLATLPKSAHPGALAALRDICNAEDIDKAQIAIHCYMSDRPARYRCAAAPSSRCNLPRSMIAPWLSLSSGAVSASIPGTADHQQSVPPRPGDQNACAEACTAKWNRQQHSAVLG